MGKLSISGAFENSCANFEERIHALRTFSKHVCQCQSDTGGDHLCNKHLPPYPNTTSGGKSYDLTIYKNCAKMSVFC